MPSPIKGKPGKPPRGRVIQFLSHLAEEGGRAYASDGPKDPIWLGRFIDDYDTDTFTRAIKLKFARYSYDADTNEGEVFLTDAGREALAAVANDLSSQPMRP